MKRLVIILFLASICYGTPFYLLEVRGDVYTSHQLPVSDSSLNVGSAILLWRYIFGDAFTDGTALWEVSSLSGFTTIEGITLTDGTFIVTGGTITSATWQGSAITVPYGGTGATTLTDGGILLGSGTSAITALGVAANGQIPIGDGTNDPVLALITGGTNLTSVSGAGSIILNVNDAFLINDGDDTTTGTVTASNFTTAGTATTDILIIGSNAPANITSVGTAGMITYDADYLYVCIANNSWKRVALTTAGWGVTGDTMIYEDTNTMIFEDGNTMVYD